MKNKLIKIDMRIVTSLLNICFLLPALICLSVNNTKAQIIKGSDLDLITYPTDNPGWTKFQPDNKIDPLTLFEDYKKDFGLPADDEMHLFNTITDHGGVTHYYFQQLHKGVKVEKGIYAVHVKEGSIFLINGKVVSSTLQNVIPSIDKNQVIELAKKYSGAESFAWEDEKLETQKKSKNPNATYYPKPDLKIISSADYQLASKTEDILAYEVDLVTLSPEIKSLRILLDANTGELLFKSSLESDCDDVTFTPTWSYYGTQHICTKSIPAGGGWLLWDTGQPAEVICHNVTYPNPFTNGNNQWTGSANKSALTSTWGIKRSNDVWGVYFGRYGYDGNNGNVDILHGAGVNGSQYNASFSPDGFCNIGLGNTSAINDDWNALDIMGHEFSHGVSARVLGAVWNNTYGWQNYYSGECGALNEGFSDIFGEVIEYYVFGNSCNFYNGWDKIENGSHVAVRSIINPNTTPGNANAHFPDTYQGTYWQFPSDPADNYGVHKNSTILSHMFYLLCQGGSGTNDNGVPYSVTGIGMSEASHLIYDALLYLPVNAQYIDMRSATLAQAYAQYGSCSNEALQLANAWKAVGVGSQNVYYNYAVCGTYPAGIYPNTVSGINNLDVANGCAVTINSSGLSVTFNATNEIVFHPGFIASNGCTFYAYLDPCALTTYKTVDGSSEHGNSNEIVKNDFALGNIPNPFSSSTDIVYMLNKDSPITLNIYNTQMQLIKSVYNHKLQTAGAHQYNFDATDLPSGIYFVKLSDGETNAFTKMVLTK